jgi:iron complex transport system substrate-binding protein
MIIHRMHRIAYMHSRFVLALTVPLFAAALCEAADSAPPPPSTMAANIEVIDDRGVSIQLAQPAERIISLAPSLTELLYVAGAGDKLVGVVEYSDYPEEALSLPLIGRFDRFDIERILELKPDLVVAWLTGNPRSTIEGLERLGLTVYVAEPKFLDSIPNQLEKLGQLAGTEGQASEAINAYAEKLTSLVNRYSATAPVRVFYQVWDRPLMTAGGAELTNDLIELCGGINIFGELTALAPKVNLEAVVLRDPELIVASGIDERRPAWLDTWDEWPSMTAVANRQVVFIDPDLTQRHSPRVLQGAEILCQQIAAARALQPADIAQ